MPGLIERFTNTVKHLRAKPTDPGAYVTQSQDIINPGLSAPVPEIKPKPLRPDGKPDTDVYGATGTPIISGFVNDLQEYNPEVRGRNALPVYEKMRRSDADVAAALYAIKLPIKSAEFKVLPGLDKSQPNFKQAQEEADFVENNLLHDLEYSNSRGNKFSQRWESVIDNCMLSLDYGCAGYEDCWTIDQDHVRLSRLAPRLPLTFYRFHIDDDGETLVAIEQWGYRGDRWVTVQVPADKFVLFSFQMEGANFYGRSILRPAWQSFYLKTALYRIDSIACERNGAGIPIIYMGPNASLEDKIATQAWASNISTHELQSGTFPEGWKFELASVTGKPKDCMPSIHHHSEMICKSMLAMFMSLGSTQTGSRALGNTMVDFFELAEKSYARFICDTISENTIRRLVDFNFPRQEGRDAIPYPRLYVPHIAVLNPLDMLGVVKDVAASGVDLIQPDDETENYIRKQLGYPAKSGQVRPRYAPVVTRIQDQSAQNPENIEEDKSGSTAAVPQGQQAPGVPNPPKPSGKSKVPTVKPALSPLAQGIQPKPAPAKLKEALLTGRALHGRMKWHGLDISIENAAGTTRSGVDKHGKKWTTTMKVPYGYIRVTR